jgi:hypothetical protein
MRKLLGPVLDQCFAARWGPAARVSDLGRRHAQQHSTRAAAICRTRLALARANLCRSVKTQPLGPLAADGLQTARVGPGVGVNPRTLWTRDPGPDHTQRAQVKSSVVGKMSISITARGSHFTCTYGYYTTLHTCGVQVASRTHDET